ncbi:hypothetical protein HMPREF9442_00232 [Paraprevotella xylaniphila YIT 11841]|uniref:Uncharacterized protein n=1 Tax=Paraprevotella xylaniphila YIT 11841 TaxID=762982 RepID=F3QPZ5_9BACT|nr:hypothetical protein HMPREF9442_00232 [Paraprevotella xylaniphila YIT 11841]
MLDKMNVWALPLFPSGHGDGSFFRPFIFIITGFALTLRHNHP